MADLTAFEFAHCYVTTSRNEYSTPGTALIFRLFSPIISPIILVHVMLTVKFIVNI